MEEAGDMDDTLAGQEAPDTASITLRWDLQETLRTNRDYAACETHDRVMQNTSPCLKWPHSTRPPDFISKEITNKNESKFLNLPPILYIVSFPRSAALKYLRHMVEVLGADINAKYCIEDAAVPGVTVGQTTPLGWFLYVTRWNPADYRAHAPMLCELLRLGADPNIPILTRFNTGAINSPLYVALVHHSDPTLFFATQLMKSGGTVLYMCDYSPLVAAMRSKGCSVMIDFFKDNFAALDGTQDMNAFHEPSGKTPMLYLIWSSLQHPIDTDEALRNVKHYIEVLNKKLHAPMQTTDMFGNLPSDIIKEARVANPSPHIQALLDYVLDLEKHEPRSMTIAIDRVLKQLPPDAAAYVRFFVGKSPLYAVRRPVTGI